MKAILNNEDVRHLVEVFYSKVLKDESLMPFFKHLDFEAHLPKMIHFWSFVLLDEPGYTTNVVEKHLNMPLEPVHFQRWLSLFNETIDELFEGEKVELAKQRAAVIAWTIESKVKNKD
jgi:hemoglobin